MRGGETPSQNSSPSFEGEGAERIKERRSLSYKTDSPSLVRRLN
jgi:hypothetical protein